MRFQALATVTGAFLVLAALALAPGSNGDRASAETFRELGDAFSAALVRGDAAAIAKMYTETAKLYPPGRVVSGRPAIERYFTPAPNRTVLDHALELEEVEVFGDRAIESGVWKSSTRRGDDDPITRSERYLLIWKKGSDGRWRIDKDFWHRPQDELTTPGARPFRPERTEVRRLTSKTNGVDYELYVALPHGYGDKGRRFPVLYTLDADYSFLLARNIVDHLSERDHLDEILVVGVGYGGPPAYRLHRTRDYTPTFVADGGYGPELQKLSGGGPKFLDFLATELIPFIEGEYAAEPAERALAGHSYGGLFAAWAMLTRPSLFSRYVVVSPSLWYDDKLLFRLEQAYAENHRALAARAYFCVGSREINRQRDMIGDLTAFVARLESRRYDGFELDSRVMQDETHNSVYPGGLSNGLRFVFEGR